MNRYTIVQARKTQEQKNIESLAKICRECGRFDKIPSHYCDECWYEMDQDLITKR